MNGEIDIYEVFKYPLLSEVVFEARFPTLLKIPKKIDEFQDEVYEMFPEVIELFMQKFLIPTEEQTAPPIKSWEFMNPEMNTKCRIFNNKFWLSSNNYKSWLKYESNPGFKDILDFTLEKFLQTFPIKKFHRLGLRYINKVKVKEQNSKWFNEFFVPLFNDKKYFIENLTENAVRLKELKNSGNELTIQAAFIKENEILNYILDFDASSLNIMKEKKIINENVDILHEIILSEFHSLITDECRKVMRGVRQF